MWKMSYQQSYGTYTYFKCRTTKESNTACTNNRSIRADRLDSIVKDSINYLLKEYYDPDAISIASPKNNTLDIISILAEEKRKSLVEIQRKRSAITMVYEDVVEGRMRREYSLTLKERIKSIRKKACPSGYIYNTPNPRLNSISNFYPFFGGYIMLMYRSAPNLHSLNLSLVKIECQIPLLVHGLSHHYKYPLQ